MFLPVAPRHYVREGRLMTLLPVSTLVCHATSPDAVTVLEDVEHKSFIFPLCATFPPVLRNPTTPRSVQLDSAQR